MRKLLSSLALALALFAPWTSLRAQDAASQPSTGEYRVPEPATETIAPDPQFLADIALFEAVQARLGQIMRESGAMALQAWMQELNASLATRARTREGYTWDQARKLFVKNPPTPTGTPATPADARNHEVQPK